MTTGYELDWDSTIESDEQQFTILEEGDYSFIVDHIERGIVGESSEKYAGMKMATVFFNVILPEHEPVIIKENLILHSNFAWKIGSLLVAVGLKKKGEPISGGYWNKLPGLRGSCHIVQNKGKNDKIYNNIEKFIEPSESKEANKWAF